nr:reverse transcriptase domain-containing protein [Tanacetum cinerariifolium]
PSVAGSQAKLYPNGKSSPGASLRSQKVMQILLGASHRGPHRPAHQASDVTSRRGRAIAKIEYFLVEKPDDASPDTSVIETPQEPWTLFMDGSSCVDGLEHEALIAGLRIMAQMRVCNVHVSVDSKLVANQVLGTYIAKEENMVKYLEKTKSLISGFTNFSISQVPRSKNKKANALSKIASTSFVYLSKQWGIDIAGPFPKGPGKVKFFIVAMEYFTKWIEAKAVATITGNQFSDNPFKDWCEKLNITQRFVSVKHPQSNRLIERVNRSLCKGIKARLGEENKIWIKELSHVLWAHRTMIKSSHGDTPFSLTYGTEAVTPAKIRMPTYRTAVVDAVYNNEELRVNLYLLEERRECAAIREAKEKLKMTKYYNTRVCGVTFRPEDFVYRSNEASHVMDGGKLSPKWEGPSNVTKALEDGAYKLRSTDGAVLPRTWNVANLNKCYL